MIDILTREKPLTKTEATEFLDYVEDTAKTQSGTWVKWLVGVSLPIISASLLFIFNLLWEQQKDLHKLDKEVNKKLDQILLQKR